jgi:hypothetical protein
MRIKYISPLLAAGAVAVSIVAAPTAAAAPTSPSVSGSVQAACGDVGPGSQCLTPGNAQINDSPPGVDYYPYGGDLFLLGGNGGFHSGFHGGHR